MRKVSKGAVIYASSSLLAAMTSEPGSHAVRDLVTRLVAAAEGDGTNGDAYEVPLTRALLNLVVAEEIFRLILANILGYDDGGEILRSLRQVHEPGLQRVLQEILQQKKKPSLRLVFEDDDDPLIN